MDLFLQRTCHTQIKPRFSLLVGEKKPLGRIPVKYHIIPVKNGNIWLEKYLAMRNIWDGA